MQDGGNPTRFVVRIMLYIIISIYDSSTYMYIIVKTYQHYQLEG